MQIRSIYIDRYAELRDRELTFDRPVTVVYGPNEAGKSSVLGLLRSVLFGFASRTSAESEREPWGGSVALTDELGRAWRIERSEARSGGSARSKGGRGGAVRVSGPDGTTGGDELLQPLLGGIGAAQFRSVFAFSLTELQELRTLQTPELNALLYGVGLGMDGRAILTAERKLVQEMDELYRPRGRNQRIAAALQQAARVDAELRESRGLQGRYDASVAELAELDSRIAGMTERLRMARARLAWLKAAEQAAVHRLQSRTAQAALAVLPPVPAGVAAGGEPLARYERLADELQRVQAEADRLAEAVRAVSGQLAVLPEVEPAMALRPMLEPLESRLPAAQQDARALAALEQSAAGLDGQLAALLRQIGEGWTAERLAAFPPIVPAREHIRRYREELETARADWSRRRDALETLEQAEAEAWQRAERNAELLARAAGPAGLAADAAEEVGAVRPRRQRASGSQGVLGQDVGRLGRGPVAGDAAGSSGRLAAAIAQLRASGFTDELAGLRRLVRQREQLRHEKQLSRPDSGSVPVRGRSARRARGATPPIVWLAAGSVAVIGVIWLVFAWLQNGLPFGLVGFAGFLLAAVVTFWVGSSLTSRVNGPAALSADAEPLDRLLQETESRLKQQWAVVSAWSEAAAAAARAGDSRSAPLPQGSDELTEDALDRLERFGQQWQEAVRGVDQAYREWEQSVEAWGQAASRCARARQEEADAAAQLQNRQAEWVGWLEHSGLTPGLSSDAALEIVHRIEQAQGLLHERLVVQDRTTELQDSLDAFRHDVESHLGRQSEPVPVTAIKTWQRTLQEAEERARERTGLLREQESLNARLEQAELEAGRIDEQIRALWASFDAADEPDFHRKAAQEVERVRLQAEKERADQLVAALMGGAVHVQELDDRLDTDGTAGLRAELEEGQRQLEQEERELDELKDQRGRLAGERDKLENGADHADLLQRREEQRTALVGLVDEWAELALAAALIRRTRQLLERERQPSLLQGASGYFRDMTKERYVRVLMPMGEERILAERSDGEFVDSAQMSRGTAEQLYLAMRFALADEASRNGQPALPIVMDDVFVNFDSSRLAQTLGLLPRLAGQRQLLYFTCHPHIVEAFERTQVPFQRIDL